MTKASFERQSGKISRREAVAALVGAGCLVAVTALSGFSPSKKQPGSGEVSSTISEKYPLHKDITTTMFWAGEKADASNDFIDNISSAWQDDWTKSFGGVDDPLDRCGYKPCGFTPQENSFYFALPFGDYTEKGPKSPEQLSVIPWYDGPLEDGKSYLKNRWIEVTFSDGKREKVAFAQWEDVGPVYDDDAEYVFGTSSPKESHSGLDVSPAVSDYLGLDGMGSTSWRFMDETDVPDGPWKELVTHSDPNWQ